MNDLQKQLYSAEAQYTLYLTRMELDEARMTPVERIERKRTFMAAYTQAMLMLKDLAALPQDQGLECVNNLFNELKDFFEKEAERAPLTNDDDSL